MRTSARLITGALAIAALAACGSPADSTTFKAPPGWTTKAQMGLMQVWGGSNADQVLMLMKLPMAVDMSSAMKSADVGNAKVEKSQDIVICNGQKATLVSASGTGKNGDRNNIDMLMTSAGGNTYMAMYVRPENAPPDGAAENALKTVCTK